MWDDEDNNPYGSFDRRDSDVDSSPQDRFGQPGTPPSAPHSPALEAHDITSRTLEPRAADDVDETNAPRRGSGKKERYDSRIEQILYEHPDLTITITYAGKNLEGGGSYIVYTIRTGDVEVRRRYSDFYSLRETLVKLHPTLIIPPIPEKHSMADYAAKPTKAKEDEAIIEHRKRMLTSFLNRCRRMDEVIADGVFWKFLDPNASWSEVLHSHPVSSLPKNNLKAPPLDPANPSPGHNFLPIPSQNAKLKGAKEGTSASSTPAAPGTNYFSTSSGASQSALDSQVLGRFPPASKDLSEEELDPYFVNFEASSKELEALLQGQMSKVNQRTISHLGSLSEDLAELGARLNGFSLSEQSQSLAAAIEKTGQAVDSTYIATGDLSSSLSAGFSEPMRESAQFAGIVRNVLRYRILKRVQEEMTRDELEKKKTLLQSLEQSEMEAQRLGTHLERSGYLPSTPPPPRRSNSTSSTRSAAHERTPSGQEDDTSTIDSDFPPNPHTSQRSGEDTSQPTSPSSHRKSSSGGNFVTSKIFGRINHAIHGMVDVDPERSRRDQIGKTKESLVQLEQARVVSEKDVKDASSGVLGSLKGFQGEKEDDLRRYMMAYARCHIEWAKRNLASWEEAKVEVDNIDVRSGALKHKSEALISAHASAPARPTRFDSPRSTRRASTPESSLSYSVTYVAPLKPSPRRQKSVWHSPGCSWSRQTGPRDKTCPGCAKEVAADAADSNHVPYEFSPREALWQQHLQDMRRFIDKDPYDALFGYSNRLMKGTGLPLGWWEDGRRVRRKAELVDEIVTPSENIVGTAKRDRKDSGVDVLEASYKWSSSGYDGRTGESWSQSGEMVYDPVEGKMVPKVKVDECSLPKAPSPKTTPSKAYDEFENQQQHMESESQLNKSLETFDAKPSSYTPPSARELGLKYDKAKRDLEKGWAAEKVNKSDKDASDDFGSAANDEFPGNSILSTQQREWERNLDNAERAAATKQTETDVQRRSSSSPQHWKDFKAGKVVKANGKPRSSLRPFTAENGASSACLSILRKEKPLKHMTVREFNRHKLAILSAFTERTQKADTAAARQPTPAEKKLSDEVERHKVAMNAWEGKWHKHGLTGNTMGQESPKHARSHTEYSTSAIAGEGDMDSKVVDYCTDKAGWYKKTALHATLDAAKDKLGADALEDEMRHIYETAYGAINTSHRQEGLKLDDSLQEFEQQPEPEKLDVALREFEAVEKQEQLDSALNEYEERHEATAVDDALKVYEKEPREGLDASLRQYEKNVIPSERYTSAPAREGTVVRPKVDAAEIERASTVVTSWSPKVVPRLQPAIDRMPLKRATKPLQSNQIKESDILEDDFTYQGEKDLFAYNGSLEDCSDSVATPARDQAAREAQQAHALESALKRYNKAPAERQQLRASESRPWGTDPAHRRRSLRRSEINPIDGTTAFGTPDLTPQTGNFASPTGFVNHDVPAASPENPSYAKVAARKVRRTEEVFSGTQPLQRESIPEIVEHFRKMGLGPELEAYARSSTLLERNGEVAPASSGGGNGSGSAKPEKEDTHENDHPTNGKGHSSGHRGGHVGKTILITVPSVLAAVYATGVVVEYFREQEEARRSRISFPRSLDRHASSAGDSSEQRGWGNVRVSPALRRRREAAAARAREEEELRLRMAWEREQEEEAAYWKKRDAAVNRVSQVFWSTMGAAAAAAVIIVGWGSGGQ
ncbi:hypothetical protein FH972_023746 [Carpinus fangiana]|uniref:PX domain-containing protein n=1 Tax=Carpinus fangiana TaxID=176857 RepID=A0A5N6KW36_9ROSI|nr:hypothetical protein FH972_023746 [Carpinus fangiana]